LRLRDHAGLFQFGEAGGVALIEFGLRGVARERSLQLIDLGAIARDVALSLMQRLFVRPRIDLEQEVAFGDVLAFGKRHADERSRYLRFDLNNGGCLHRTHQPQFGGNRFERGPGCGDRCSGRTRCLPGRLPLARMEREQAEA